MSDYRRGERGERGERGPSSGERGERGPAGPPGPPGPSSPNISASVVIAIGSMLIGIAGTVFASGGYIKQIEVNTATLKDISEHGTGILQSLKTQVQNQQVEINGIRNDFRPREFWEQLERRLASIEQQQGRQERLLQDGRK